MDGGSAPSPTPPAHPAPPAHLAGSPGLPPLSKPAPQSSPGHTRSNPTLAANPAATSKPSTTSAPAPAPLPAAPSGPAAPVSAPSNPRSAPSTIPAPSAGSSAPFAAFAPVVASTSAAPTAPASAPARPDAPTDMLLPDQQYVLDETIKALHTTVPWLAERFVLGTLRWGDHWIVTLTAKAIEGKRMKFRGGRLKAFMRAVEWAASLDPATHRPYNPDDIKPRLEAIRKLPMLNATGAAGAGGKSSGTGTAAAKPASSTPLLAQQLGAGASAPSGSSGPAVMMSFSASVGQAAAARTASPRKSGGALASTGQTTANPPSPLRSGAALAGRNGALPASPLGPNGTASAGQAPPAVVASPRRPGLAPGVRKSGRVAELAGNGSAGPSSPDKGADGSGAPGTATPVDAAAPVKLQGADGSGSIPEADAAEAVVVTQKQRQQRRGKAADGAGSGGKDGETGRGRKKASIPLTTTPTASAPVSPAKPALVPRQPSTTAPPAQTQHLLKATGGTSDVEMGLEPAAGGNRSRGKGAARKSVGPKQLPALELSPTDQQAAVTVEGGGKDADAAPAGPAKRQRRLPQQVAVTGGPPPAAVATDAGPPQHSAGAATKPSAAQRASQKASDGPAKGSRTGPASAPAEPTAAPARGKRKSMSDLPNPTASANGAAGPSQLQQQPSQDAKQEAAAGQASQRLLELATLATETVFSPPSARATNGSADLGASGDPATGIPDHSPMRLIPTAAARPRRVVRPTAAGAAYAADNQALMVLPSTAAPSGGAADALASGSAEQGLGPNLLASAPVVRAAALRQPAEPAVAAAAAPGQQALLPSLMLRNPGNAKVCSMCRRRGAHPLQGCASHSACTECISAYVQTRVAQRLPLTCPAGCAAPLAASDVERVRVGPEAGPHTDVLYSKAIASLTQAHVRHSMGGAPCPNCEDGWCVPTGASAAAGVADGGGPPRVVLCCLQCMQATCGECFCPMTAHTAGASCEQLLHLKANMRFRDVQQAVLAGEQAYKEVLVPQLVDIARPQAQAGPSNAPALSMAESLALVWRRADAQLVRACPQCLTLAQKGDTGGNDVRCGECGGHWCFLCGAMLMSGAHPDAGGEGAEAVVAAHFHAPGEAAALPDMLQALVVVGASSACVGNRAAPTSLSRAVYCLPALDSVELPRPTLLLPQTHRV